MLAEFAVVLREVQRVTRELEAHMKVTMFHDPWYLHEFYEAWQLTVGSVSSFRRLSHCRGVTRDGDEKMNIFLFY